MRLLVVEDEAKIVAILRFVLNCVAYVADVGGWTLQVNREIAIKYSRKEEDSMNKAKKACLGLTVVFGLVNLMVWAGAPQDKERAELAKGVGETKVSLAQGLSASAGTGQPISAKFEIDEGKLQLSVYAAKGGKFSEVIVDHNTGKVSKAEPITSGDDLTDAKAQSEAMARAKESLRAALDKVLKTNSGYRAVSVIPALKDGHPVADVTLVMGNQWKTASEKLD